MASRRYSKADLLRLRASPLVQKPNDLPAIEQWIEYVYVYEGSTREKLRIPHSEAHGQQSTQSSSTNSNARRPPGGAKGGDASPMGSFSTGTRPSLIGTRSTTVSKNDEEVSLGPPRTTFPSSRTVHKLSDNDKTHESDAGDEGEAPRSRFFGEKANRKSFGEKEPGSHKDTWIRAGERRAVDDDEKGESRYGRRDRDQNGDRRLGYGEKHDSRWAERRQNGDRQGGWRERERERRDKDGGRPGPGEREPEWMDEPALPNAEDDLRTMGMPRTQEQFQRWKETMSGKRGQSEGPEALEPETPAQEMATAKVEAPMKLEVTGDKPFGNWGDGKNSASTPAPIATPSLGLPQAKIAQTAKSKPSRFASMFKDTQGKDETLPAETAVQAAANEVANGSAEDEAGFKRILQMLGNTGVSQPPATESPSSPPSKGGSRKTSRFTGFFDNGPKSPERVPPVPQQPDLYTRDGNGSQGRHRAQQDHQATSESRLYDGQRGLENGRSAEFDNLKTADVTRQTDGGREARLSSGRVGDLHVEDPPSRGAATPDINIQNLLASQRASRPQGQDKNSEFLLNLLQNRGSRPPSQQARPDTNFPLWLDQPPSRSEPLAPKPRAPPPPGLFEDHLLRHVPPEAARQEHQGMPEMLQRRTSQRQAPPPGFYDEQHLFLQQQQQQQQQAAQRRTFTEPPHQAQPGRRIAGHPGNVPPLPMPPQHFNGPPPPDFLQSPGGGQGPPPGFNPHMPRHPPGVHNIPNIFQAPQPPPQQQQAPQQLPQPPRGDFPPGFGPAGPPNVPPGFFGNGLPPQPHPSVLGAGLPPGFLPQPQQLRSPIEGMRGRGFEGFDTGMGGGQRR